MKDRKSIIPSSFNFNMAYILPSAGGWLCFGLVLTTLNFLVGRRDMVAELYGNIILTFCCLLGTHLIRMLIISSGRRASWRTISIRAFLVGVPLFALLMAVLITELNAIAMPERFVNSKHSLASGLLGLWFFMTILFGGWTGVYVSAIAMQKSNRAEVERLSLETALREAELRALKAQINPHFLFNSLNTIRALINEHPDRAQEAVLHLSLILRAALQSDRQLRPLREELDTTTHYLKLEHMRFEARLKVRIEADPASMDCLVPAMLMQTLVENAVKHGIGRTVNGGEIFIKSTLREGRCIITISNPGTLGVASEGTGLGLKNARMRLHRLLGEDARLILCEHNSTVTAELDIPAGKDDRNHTSR